MIKKLAGIELGIRTFIRKPSHLPQMVQIAINSKCNLSCKMCPREKIPQLNENMQMENFKQIIAKLTGVKRIALVGLGEPFLHPDLLEIIKYTKKKGFFVQTTTNGTLFKNEKKILEIFSSDLDVLSISLESINGTSINGHNFKLITQQIEKLMEVKKKFRVKKPIISLQIVLLNEVIGELSEIIIWAEKIGIDRISITRANAILIPELERPTLKKEKMIQNNLTKKNKKSKVRIDFFQNQIFPGILGKLYQFFLPLARLENWCIKWAYYTYISANGDVRPCSGLYPKELVLGNIFDENLEEIWTGSKYQALRASQAKWNPCAACDNLRLKQRKSPGIDKKMKGSEIGVI